MDSSANRYTLEALNPDGFLALRPRGERAAAPDDFLCDYANPAAEALLGPGLAGQPLLAGRPALAGMLAPWSTTVSTGERTEHAFSWGEGEAARQVRARAVRMEDGRLAVWLADITEEARFVVDAEAFEERMSAYVECMPDAFLALDGGFRVRHANRAAEKLLGFSRDELLGRSLWDAYAEGPESTLRRQLQRALSTGRTVEFEECLATHQVHLRATAVPASGGLLVYLADITQRRRTEDALRRTSALFTAVLQGCTDAIYTKDLAGRYTRINAAGARLMGKTVEEVVGHTDAELWPEEARTTTSHDREVLAFRHTFTYEESQRGPKQRVWLSTKGVLKDDTGTVFGLFGISRDITERKAMEEALRRNEARMLQALSAASLTLFDLRLPEGVLHWERNAAALFGQAELPGEETLGTFLSRVHPEDRLGVAERLARCAEAPGEVVLDYRVTLPDGQVRRQALRARSRAEDGRIGRVLGVLADITQRQPGTPGVIQAA
ncbi:PAS domain-containing protein [Pyxidicoccus fallax]|uniref:PAS domain-containing protein n=1 Tax=Pyxidicoccus fallax TaxID=394095 RepID=A0A848LNE3_9BACT|nr:PAS domain-containing protein [Pyxidicoccus fallax]NMO19190.1 PAS domain-containing protein [Pyxidicoccus fallax]NPC80219.1 PAS domain-containing protein [Pyxidicoccus fallax]